MTPRPRRRDVIGLLAGAAAWPRLARAQGARKTIGVLGAGAKAAWAPMIDGFEQRLRELGWIIGNDLEIDYRWADGRTERFQEIAAEFVRLKVDVILTAGSAIPAAKQVAPSVPIVFAVAVDPVASGFVESLARPGGNVTGLSLQSSEIAPKRIEILREAIPGLAHIAVLANRGYQPAIRESAIVQQVAGHAGIGVSRLDITSAEEIAPAIASLDAGARALYVCTESLAVTNSSHINAVALGAHIATLWGAREFIRKDGFMSYGPNEVDQFRLSADYVDKILKGARPADLPVVQPTKIDLAVNLRTAKALRLAVPESFLVRADEVIE